MKSKMSILKSLWMIIVVFLVFAAKALPIFISIPFMLIALAAPLYREFRPKSDLDERQIQLSHFSSQIAFYLYIALLLAVLIIEYFTKQENPPNLFYMLLLTPLSVKFLISIFQNFNGVQAATYVGLFFSSIFLLFNLLAHNIFTVEGIIQASPFIVLLAASLLSKKYPLISGLIFALLALISLVIFKSAFDIYLKIMMFSVLTLPFLFCSYVLLFPKKEKLS